MKRFILFILIFLFCVGNAYAVSFTDARSATDDTLQFSVADTNTYYTKSIKMSNVDTSNDVGVMYKATSADNATVELRLEAESSFNPPATEGSADAEYLVNDVLEASLGDEDWHLATIDTTILPYLRFKVTGTGSNGDNILLQIKVIKE